MFVWAWSITKDATVIIPVKIAEDFLSADRGASEINLTEEEFTKLEQLMAKTNFFTNASIKYL